MKKISINGTEYSVVFGFKALMEYELLTGTKMSQLSITEDNLTDIVKIGYCAVKAGAILDKSDFNLTVDEFMVKLDVGEIEITELLSLVNEGASEFFARLNAKTDDKKKVNAGS